MLPPRLAHSTPWADMEIARLTDHLAALEHRNAQLLHEAGQLRRALFEESACNMVVRGLEIALADAKGAVVVG